jgi:hypothetical protein
MQGKKESRGGRREEKTREKTGNETVPGLTYKLFDMRGGEVAG